MRWSIRNFLPAAIMLASTGLLGSCSIFPRGDAGQIYQLAKGMWFGNQKVTLAEAASIPYASIGLRVGDSSQTMLLLASDENGQRLWTSSSRVAITTQDGRITQTAGLGDNIHAYDVHVSPPGNGGDHRVDMIADFPELNLYSIKISCVDRLDGDQIIVILEKEIRTRRVKEHCETNSSLDDWSFENMYWVDPSSGLVWRSVQHVNPRIDAIEIEVLRPPE